MPASRPSKRPAATKTRRGLDDSPGRRTRSQTHRDRLCALLLKLDPAAMSSAVKVLGAYDEERSASQGLVEWDRLVVKHLCGRHAAPVRPTANKPTANKPATSPSISRRNALAASSSTSLCGSTVMSSASTTYITPRPFGWSPTTNTPTKSKPSSESEVRALFSSAEDTFRFIANVLVVWGDIGSITHIGDHKIDGIAFPTASNLRNSGIGAAAAMFRRAGDELSTHVQGVQWHSSNIGAGGVRVTPAFGAGVKKLIHAVGPSASTPQCHHVLEATYTSVLEAAQREDLQYLALASISTGNNGIPAKEGARAALRAIQQFLAKEKWSGVVGIVCYEQKIFDAFILEKQAMIEASNARCV